MTTVAHAGLTTDQCPPFRFPPFRFPPAAALLAWSLRRRKFHRRGDGTPASARNAAPPPEGPAAPSNEANRVQGPWAKRLGTLSGWGRTP